MHALASCFPSSLHSRTNQSSPHYRLRMGDHTKNKLYMSHPKGYGKGSRQCRVTGRLGGMGLIRKYGINMKRQVFRERAEDMGWKKYS